MNDSDAFTVTRRSCDFVGCVDSISSLETCQLATRHQLFISHQFYSPLRKLRVYSRPFNHPMVIKRSTVWLITEIRADPPCWRLQANTLTDWMPIRKQRLVKVALLCHLNTIFFGARNKQSTLPVAQYKNLVGLNACYQNVKKFWYIYLGVVEPALH